MNLKIGKDLCAIHQDIFNKLKLDRDIAREEQEAKQLTQFLMSIKNFLYTNERLYAEGSNAYKDAEKVQEYLRNTTAQMLAEELLSDVDYKNRKGKLLFQKEGTQHTFEEVFSVIQKLAYEAATGENIDEEVFRGGQTLAGIGGKVNEKGNARLDLTKIPDNIAKMTLQQLQKYFGKNLKSKEQAFMYFNQVDQKIDNKALKLNIKFKAGLSPYAHHIYDLLLTRNFSLKNYASAGMHDLSTETLEIGNTTFFRSIISTLQYSGLSYDDAIKYFYRGISAIENHNDIETIRHFNHLKHIYEYTGAGQKVYTGDGEWVDLDTVDFIIYNDPSSTFIQVVSVKKALKEAIEKLNDQNKLVRNVSYVADRTGKVKKFWRPHAKRS